MSFFWKGNWERFHQKGLYEIGRLSIFRGCQYNVDRGMGVFYALLKHIIFEKTSNKNLGSGNGKPSKMPKKDLFCLWGVQWNLLVHFV